MARSIRAGDVVVCRVNGTSDLYVIGTVTTGTVGDFSLSGVTTVVGRAQAIEGGYRNRTPEERVWLFDGAASGYVNTSAPRGQLYHAYRGQDSSPPVTQRRASNFTSVHKGTAGRGAAP
jgi:hypothetical protein